MNEVLEYANETRHILLVNFQIVSEQWFQGLPEEIREVLVEECRAAGQETSGRIAESQEAAKQQLLEAGMTVVEDVDMDAFRAAGIAAFEVLGLGEAAAQIRGELGN